VFRRLIEASDTRARQALSEEIRDAPEQCVAFDIARTAVRSTGIHGV